MSSTTSSDSGILLTPTTSATGTSRSTYRGQHNVTPTPEREVPRIMHDIGNLNLGDDGSSHTANHNDFGDDPDYDLRSENLPDAPIYDARLQTALRDTKTKLSELYDAMEMGPVLPNLANLAQQTNRLSGFEYPQTRTIGLVGDSGVGKSSLINSLLDENGIARSSGDGGACTNIVTEYRYRDSRRGPQYSFEVEYMSSEEIKVLLEDLVFSYRAYHTDAYREIQNDAEREDIRAKAERSTAALNSLFREHPRYSEESLSREGPDAASEVVRELEGMVEEVQRHRPGGPTASRWSATANTVDDLTTQLDVFIRMRSLDGSPIIWPFVGIIRVYLRSLFLRSGVVLADLPGLRDLNYARVRATDRYMRSCHEILAVARIDRVTTDVGLQDIVRRCGNQRPLRIICTRAEEVNAAETRISIPALAFRIRALQTVIDPLRRRLEQIDDEMERNPSAAGWEQAGRLRHELNQAEFRLQEFLVNSRNQRVRESLRRTYANQVLNNDLKIFCISNVEYSQNRHKPASLATKRVELSGIPELRQYCQSIPAAAQFGAVASFLEHQVPSLLGSIRQWLVQGSDGMPAERADALRAALNQSRDRFSEWTVLVLALQRNVKRDFRTSIVSSFDQHKATWAGAARNASQLWMGWAWGTFAAFCRNYGDYETAASRGPHNWNDDIVSAMRERLDPDWTGFVQQVSQRIDATFESISDMFEREEEALSNCIELAPNAIGTLLQNMGHKRDCIEDLLERASDDFIEQLERIQSDALNGHPSSYITDKMRPTYLSAQGESGTGSDARRKGHMRQTLSGTTLFLDLKRTVKDAQTQATEDGVENIRTALQREFDTLLHDIQSVVVEEGEVSESQRYPQAARVIRRRVDRLGHDLELHRHVIAELRTHPSLQ